MSMKSAVVKICNRNEIIFDTVFPRTFFFLGNKEILYSYCDKCLIDIPCQAQTVNSQIN